MISRHLSRGFQDLAATDEEESEESLEEFLVAIGEIYQRVGASIAAIRKSFNLTGYPKTTLLVFAHAKTQPLEMPCF
ncbi:MAG TPA: hypothetical protein V6C82_05510 [Chroococcales cyanobacterium]|jgi:hypothetical protein